MADFKCWLPSYEDEDSAISIDSIDVEDAASDACQKWSDRGAWSGDPIPQPIEVHVRDAEGKLWLVKVEPQWDVSFWSMDKKEVT